METQEEEVTGNRLEDTRISRKRPLEVDGSVRPSASYPPGPNAKRIRAGNSDAPGVIEPREPVPSAGTAATGGDTQPDNTAETPSVFARVTRSQSRKPPPRLEAFAVPQDSLLLDLKAPGEPWHERFARFRKAVFAENESLQDEITPQILTALAREYLSNHAWVRLPNKTTRVLKARKTLEELGRSGVLQSIWQGTDAREQTLTNDSGGSSLENKATATATTTTTNPRFCNIAGNTFKLPDDGLLLDPDYPDENWGDRILRFCVAVLEENDGVKDTITQEVFILIFLQFLRRCAWAHTPGRRQKSREAKDAFKAMEDQKNNPLASVLPKGGAGGAQPWPKSQGDSDDAPDVIRFDDSAEEGDGFSEAKAAPTATEWASLLESEPKVPQASGEGGGQAMDNGTVEHRLTRQVVDEAQALEEQQRYFSTVSGPHEICTVCASIDHTSLDCPRTTCSRCHGDHYSWACPSRQRCGKCRQLGHRKSQCKEKLAMTRDEGLDCSFCGSVDHLEDDCDQIWRSYHPLPEQVKQVRDIAAFCALCGVPGHYFSECRQRRNQTPSATWSMKNRDLYVDRASANLSIAEAAARENGGHIDLRMGGLPTKRTHVFYPDSDGSEEGEFLGERVRPRGDPPGKIRMATNIQFANAPRPPPAHAQPPLPPGPPPAGPPPRAAGPPRARGSYSGMASLPPRPTGPPPPAQAPPQQQGRPGGQSRGGNGRGKKQPGGGGGASRPPPGANPNSRRGNNRGKRGGRRGS